jgi:hypothetical protein
LTLNQLVPGSSPGGATTFFVLWICRRSSTVEHLFCKQAVIGSIPIAGSLSRSRRNPVFHCLMV